MTESIRPPLPLLAAAEFIPLPNLAFAAIPVLVVIAVLWRWSLGTTDAVVAFLRMVVQLLLVGFVLSYVFGATRPPVVLGVLCVMLVAAGAIAVRTAGGSRWDALRRAVVAIVVGGVPTLFLLTAGILRVDPWFAPNKVVPLAGMVFANAMNGIGLAAERYAAERANGHAPPAARQTALKASLIPITNSFLAVGIVSFPGMMTGQILSGVDPLVAVRYQIVVMCMVFGSAGISSATYLAMTPEAGPPPPPDDPTPDDETP